MVSNVQFLLIQDGLVDHSDRPDNLMFSLVDPYAGFKVVVGCVNEFKEREIVGVVAEVAPVEGCNTWRVSSIMDGYDRLVGAAGSPASFIRVRLGVMYQNGDFEDLCRLPSPVTVVPGEAPVAA